MIEIKEITEKNVWEDFVLAQPENSFFQSWNWGEVQKKLKTRFSARNLLKASNSELEILWRVGVFDNETLVGVAQVIKVIARRGNFLHLRHGPIFKSWKEESFNVLLKFLMELGIKEKVWFIRISPLIENLPDNKIFFKKFGFKPAVIPRLDASLAWVLDVTKSGEELLGKMRKTTRYLIHKAQKTGIIVYEGNKESDFDAFLKIYQETAQRQHFVPHLGIKEEFEILGKAGELKLFLAKYQEKIMAAALIVFYGNQAVYHHSGATLNSNIPAMHALLWQAICEAKKSGKTIFNFWGIGPLAEKSDPWWGLTLFKTGFGGKAREFLPTQDLPLSPLYSVTKLIETLWKMRRRY